MSNDAIGAPDRVLEGHFDVGVVQDLRVRNLQVAHEEGVADGERGDVEIHVLRDVGREHLDLELAKDVVEHAAEVPHPVGYVDEADRHLEVISSSARTS